MGIAKLYGQKSSGMSINGIIQGYHAYAGENISAGDLVEYINGIAGQTSLGISQDTTLLEITNGAWAISAVELDENRVFIAHSYGDNFDLYGMVVTIDGITITAGTDTKLGTDNKEGLHVSTVALDSSRVFVAHSYGSDYYLYAMVVTINGTTITKGTDISLVGATSGSTGLSLNLLEDNKVFVAHGYTTSSYVYGKVCTIDGTNISQGKDISIDSTLQSNSGYTSSEVLSNGDIFVVHSSGRGDSIYNKLKATILSVSGTTLTKKTSEELSEVDYTGTITSTIVLEKDKIFIAHSYTSYYYLYGLIVNINNGTITKGVDTQLNGEAKTGRNISTVLSSTNKVFVAHSYGDSFTLNGLVCDIDEMSITKGADTQLNVTTYTGYVPPSLISNNGTIFIAHCYTNNRYLHAQIFDIDDTNNIPTSNVTIAEYETQVRKTTTSQFDGIAKTGGVGGTTTTPKDYVSVYTL